jgi:hypothetical protein
MLLCHHGHMLKAHPHAPDIKHEMFCTTGPQLDVPHSVTPAQLEVLLNGLLHNEEKLPYTFLIQDQVCYYCVVSCFFWVDLLGPWTPARSLPHNRTR